MNSSNKKTKLHTRNMYIIIIKEHISRISFYFYFLKSNMSFCKAHCTTPLRTRRDRGALVKSGGAACLSRHGNLQLARSPRIETKEGTVTSVLFPRSLFCASAT